MVKSTNRKRRNKATASDCKIEIVKEIQKQIKIKKGLSAAKINCLLANESHFLGCFADDDLKNLAIQSFPAYLIVNLDKSSQDGSHWICLRIERKTIDIFDPLGFRQNFGLINHSIYSISFTIFLIRVTLFFLYKFNL